MQPPRLRTTASIAVLALLATPAFAEPQTSTSLSGSTESANMIGIALPLPGKASLPRREDAVVLAVTGAVLAGDGFGGEVAGEIRLVESFGIGLGARATNLGASPFLRMTPLGLAVNHWSWIAYADLGLTDGSWAFGGAMIVPLRKDKYLRLSVTGQDGSTIGGVGLEADVW
jgi:hypothetical protein